MATVQKQHVLYVLSNEIAEFKHSRYVMIPDVFCERDKLTSRAYIRGTVKQRALVGASSL